MKNVITILATILLLAFIPAIYAQETQENTNYEEMINQACKEAQTKETLVQSWRNGVLHDYNLILDRMEIKFTQDYTSSTTENQTLVCGTMVDIGYCKTEDGIKKRVVSKRYVCYIFDKVNQIGKAKVMQKQDNIVLDGWNDFIEI